MSELNPCPFCGSDASIRRSHDEDDCMWVSVKCNGCSCETRGKWVSHSSDACPNFYAEVREEWNQRTLPEGMALVPREITAETGHKAGMMSEFSQSIPMRCDTCDGEGTIDETLGGESFSDPDAACPDCDGAGEYGLNVNISWTTIKAIHKRIVKIAEGDRQ